MLKLAQKCSFHTLVVLPAARNAKFQSMYQLPGHSNKVLMNGRSKCLSVLYFRPARNYFQFGNNKISHWERSGEYGGEAKRLHFLSSKTLDLFRRYEWEHCHVEDGYV